MKTKIYYRHDAINESQQVFDRKAVAVCIDLDEWYAEAKFHEPTFQFSENTYCGFIHCKVYEIWDGLSVELGGLAPFDAYEETTLLHQGLKEAQIRLNRYIQKLDMAKIEDILWAWDENNEYRIVLDNEEFRTKLKELSAFIGESSAKPNKSIEFWL